MLARYDQPVRLSRDLLLESNASFLSRLMLLDEV
jgi:hypothetical protein